MMPYLILLDLIAFTMCINVVEADILLLVELCKAISIHVPNLTPVVFQESPEGRRHTEKMHCSQCTCLLQVRYMCFQNIPCMLHDPLDLLDLRYIHV